MLLTMYGICNPDKFYIFSREPKLLEHSIPHIYPIAKNVFCEIRLIRGFKNSNKFTQKPSIHIYFLAYHCLRNFCRRNEVGRINYPSRKDPSRFNADWRISLHQKPQPIVRHCRPPLCTINLNEPSNGKVITDITLFYSSRARYDVVEKIRGYISPIFLPPIKFAHRGNSLSKTIFIFPFPIARRNVFETIGGTFSITLPERDIMRSRQCEGAFAWFASPTGGAKTHPNT